MSFERIVLSYSKAAHMAGVQLQTIKKAVDRERLTKVENVTDGRVEPPVGVFLSELAEYYGWSQGTLDELTDWLAIGHADFDEMQRNGAYILDFDEKIEDVTEG